MCIVKQYRYHYIDGRTVEREKRYNCSDHHCRTTRIYQSDPEYESYPMARPLSDYPPDRNNPNTTGNGVGVEFTVNNTNTRRNTASGVRIEPARTIHVTRHIYPAPLEQPAYYPQSQPALHSAHHPIPIPAEANVVHVSPRHPDTPPLTPRSSNRGRSRSRSFSLPFREHRRRDYYGRSRSAQGNRNSGRGHSRPRQQSPHPRRAAPGVDLQAIADHINSLEIELERARRSSTIESEIRRREQQLAELRERRREEQSRRERVRATRRNPAPIIHQDNPPRQNDGPREHERRPTTGGGRVGSPSRSPIRGPSFEERGLRFINDSIRDRNNPRSPRLRGGRDESVPRIGFTNVLEGILRRGRD